MPHVTLNPKFPEALQNALDRKDWTHAEFARRVGYTRSTVSMYCSGSRPVPAADAARMCRLVDDPELCAAFIYDFTGGVALWLDGDRVDHHRMSVLAKATEEGEEALDAIRCAVSQLVNARNVGELTEEGVRLLDAAHHNIAEAMLGFNQLLADSCIQFERSYMAVWDRLRSECHTKGYMRKEVVHHVSVA